MAPWHLVFQFDPRFDVSRDATVWAVGVDSLGLVVCPAKGSPQEDWRRLGSLLRHQPYAPLLEANEIERLVRVAGFAGDWKARG